MDERKASEQKTATQMADLIGQFLNRLTGNGAIISYSFRNLEIDIPKTSGPHGQELISAKWVVNGEIVISVKTESEFKEVGTFKFGPPS